MANGDLKSIVQRMIDAGESEDAIGSVIQRYNELNPPKPAQFNPNPPPLSPVSEPTDFASGVMKSLGQGEGGPGFFSSDAWNTGMQGLSGYVKGAITDLPSTILSGIKSAGEAFQDPTGLTRVGRAMLNPQGPERQQIAAMQEIPAQIGNTVSQAGTRPEEFGRLMGQVTGQPLVTAGISEAIPPTVRGLGRPVEATGSLIRRTQPASGMLPFGGVRTLRNLERWAGSGIEEVGRRMKNAFPPVLEGEVVPDFTRRTTEYTETPNLELPPSGVDFYQGPGGPRRLLTGQIEMGSQSPSPMHGGSPIEEVPKAPISPRTRGNPGISSSGEVIPLEESSLTRPPKLTMENAPIGQIVNIKQKFASPEIVKMLKDNGFEFQELKPDGSFRFKKIDPLAPPANPSKPRTWSNTRTKK